MLSFFLERNLLIKPSQTPSEPCSDYFGWYWHIICQHFPVFQHLIDWGFFSLMQLFHWDPGRRVIVRAAPGVALSDCNSIISGLAMTIIPGAHRASPKKLFHKLRCMYENVRLWKREDSLALQPPSADCVKTGLLQFGNREFCFWCLSERKPRGQREETDELRVWQEGCFNWLWNSKSWNWSLYMIIRENIGDFCPSLSPIQMYRGRISHKITIIFM